MPSSRLATGSKAIVVAIAGASAPVCRATRGQPEGRQRDGDEGIHVPVAQEREDAVVEPVDGRLRQRRRQAEEDAGRRPGERSLRGRPAGENKLAVAPGERDDDRRGDQPVVHRRVVLAAGGSLITTKAASPAHASTPPGRSTASDPLGRVVRTEWKGEDDARYLERLHDDQPSEAERRRLRHGSKEHAADAEEPHRPAENAEERALPGPAASVSSMSAFCWKTVPSA